MTTSFSLGAIAAPSPSTPASGAPRARVAAQGAETAGLFSSALDHRKTDAKPASVPPVSVSPASVPDASSLSRGSKTGEMKPEQQFEGFMLRTFVESMLPSENSSFYGEGTAGGIWESMLAERIGDEMAAAGGIGIADMLTERRDARAAKAAGQAGLDARASDAGALAFKGLGGL